MFVLLLRSVMQATGQNVKSVILLGFMVETRRIASDAERFACTFRLQMQILRTPITRLSMRSLDPPSSVFSPGTRPPSKRPPAASPPLPQTIADRSTALHIIRSPAPAPRILPLLRLPPRLRSLASSPHRSPSAALVPVEPRAPSAIPFPDFSASPSTTRRRTIPPPPESTPTPRTWRSIAPRISAPRATCRRSPPSSGIHSLEPRDQAPLLPIAVHPPSPSDRPSYE